MKQFRWSRWLHASFRFPRRRRPRSFLPQVTLLEDRRLLSTTLSSEPGFSSYAGVGFQENAVAGLYGVFNGQPYLKVSDYHAQINWGDSNQWDMADLASANPGSPGSGFLVKGSHTYAQAGTYHVVVYAQGADGASTSGETVRITVSQMPSG